MRARLWVSAADGWEMDRPMSAKGALENAVNRWPQGRMYVDGAEFVAVPTDIVRVDVRPRQAC